MLKVSKFSATDDVHVLKDFDSYRKGDIIPGGKLEKSKAVKLWLSGIIQNVGVKKYSKKELESMSFLSLKELGEPYGITDRSKKNLIKELMAVL